MNIIKSPQDNISAYLYNAVNIEIFEEYERCKYKGRKEPLDFFNLLYSELAFFNENIENYLTIKSHFKDYDSKVDYYKVENDEVLSSNLMDHYEALVKLIKEKYPFNLREGVILKSCEYIEAISDVLTTMKYGYGYGDQMNDILKENESLNYYEKMENLIQIKYISLRNEALFVDKRGITIASKIDLEIERLGQLKQLEIETPQSEPIHENKNPFPQIFTGDDTKTFALFETFTKQHIIDKYIDFSFIFQQMKYNGYISDVKHVKFMNWLKENQYINNKEYSFFIEQNSFRSLKKCAFGTRVDLYLKLQEDIIQSDSDKSE